MQIPWVTPDLVYYSLWHGELGIFFVHTYLVILMYSINIIYTVSLFTFIRINISDKQNYRQTIHTGPWVTGSKIKMGDNNVDQRCLVS